MRAFALALFIAALMVDIPAQAGHSYQIGNVASIHRLKAFLRHLGVPHKARRKTAAPRKPSDTGQQASVEKTAPGTDAKPTTQEAPAAAKAVAGKPAATAVQSKGKKVEQKSTATPAVTGKPKENPVSPPITPASSGKKTAKTLKEAIPKEAAPAPAKTVATPLAKPEDSTTTEGPAKTRPKAVVTALRPGDLVEFDRQPERIRQIISAALAMTEMDLYYAYGSNNPKNGGMDCSGTIQYLLRSQGFRDAPRQADLIFSWSKEKGTLIPANVHRIDAPELKGLRPGDLLFWSGTYSINRSISHVMMYLGTEKATHLPVMFGASSGRTYHGESRHGVSVFDFKLPRPEEKARFEGYGPIPGMFTTAEDAQSPRS